MKLLAAAAALVITVAGGFAPALARDSYVMDNASLFSPATVAQINAKVGDFNAQTHKEVVVVTVPSFTGTATDAEERAFAEQRVNGVLIYIAKSPKTIAVIPDRVSGQFFPAGSTAAIRQAIVSAFNSGDFNGGINNGVDLTLAEYRSHLGSLRSSPVRTEAAPIVRNDTGGGFNMSLIWWLIVPPISLLRPPLPELAVLLVKVQPRHRRRPDVFEAAAERAGGVAGEGAADSPSPPRRW